MARLAKAPRAAPTAWAVVRTRADHVMGAAATHPAFAPARVGARLAGAVWAELDDPFTPILLVGATASALLGSAVDAFLVIGAVAGNALVGGVQRLRAEQALSELVTGQRRTARRLPGVSADEATLVEAERLTPGDVIELRTNDVVPADARLLEVSGFEVDESSLTGESLPTRKQVAAVPQAPVADRSCMVFEGTTVVAGHARAVVVGTGDQTEAGRAASLAARVPTSAGVQARLHRLTRRVLPLTLAGGAAVAGLSLLRGRPVRTALQGGLAVAVAAVPEGMPLVATVAQMAAARRLSRLGVLVRTPRSLEALGRVDTMCFDKTGTLTENRLRVVRLITAAGAEHPAFGPEAEPILRIAARACPRVAEQPGAHAHATDEAVLAAAPRETGWTTVRAQPFEASRGYAAAVGRGDDGEDMLVVKGAPEVMLPCCPAADPTAVDTAHALAAQGLRLLAVAQRRLAAEEATEALDKPLELLELIGFVALADTPRASSAPLVAGLGEVGVRPVMLTGDHPQTARSVAVALGWPSDVTVVTGDELAALDRAGRARLLRDCGVVARVAPEQKLQVVEALREAGRVVGMVGDGANDAAAIRAADVGIGIAARGSAAARNAADLVITNDELSVLIDAIGEGRALWRSVADAISILLGGNAGEVGFSVLGTLLSGTSPLTTRQLLLVNLLTDMFPAMAVAVTPHDPEPEGEPTADDDAPVGLAVLGRPLTRQIRDRGLITGIGGTVAWLIGSLTPGSVRRTSTMALCGVVGAQLTQTVVGRRHSPLVLATVLGTAAVLIALVQTPVVSHFFGCTPLGPLAWAAWPWPSAPPPSDPAYCRRPTGCWPTSPRECVPWCGSPTDDLKVIQRGAGSRGDPVRPAAGSCRGTGSVRGLRTVALPSGLPQRHRTDPGRFRPCAARNRACTTRRTHDGAGGQHIPQAPGPHRGERRRSLHLVPGRERAPPPPRPRHGSSPRTGGASSGHRAGADRSPRTPEAGPHRPLTHKLRGGAPSRAPAGRHPQPPERGVPVRAGPVVNAPGRPGGLGD